MPGKKPLGILFLGGNSQNFLKDFGRIEIPCVLVSNDASGLPFDNLSSVALGSFLVPELSTVIQSARKMAQRSVDILISRIEHGGHAYHEAVPHSLHQRESTRRIDDD